MSQVACMTRTHRIILKFGLFCALGSIPVQVEAQSAEAALKGAQWLVVLDAVPTEALKPADGAELTRIYSFSLTKRSPCVDEIVAELKKVGDGDNRDRLKKIRESSPCAAEFRSRWISNKGDKLAVVAFYLDSLKNPQRISIDETARTSRIEGDLRTLIELAPNLPAGAANLAQPDILARVTSYRLKQERANVKITFAGASDAGAGGTPGSLTTSLITGPTERLFLSASVGVSSAKQLKYDKGTNSVGPAETPKQFYISANISVSDLYDDHLGSGLGRIARSAFAGILVEGSRKPFDQVGAFIGLRYLPVVSRIVDLNTVSPFAGLLWVKDDSLSNGSTQATKVISRYAGARGLFGIALNLSQSLNWVGGSGKAPAK